MTSILTLLGVFLLSLRVTGVQSIGVCYGLNGNNLQSSQDVINLYNQNGIQKMRIYSPVPEVLNALRGTNIELLIDVANEDIQALATDPSAAANWVQNNIQSYSPDVKFRYIAVGNEVSLSSSIAQYVGPAMGNIQNALASAGLEDQIKVSTSISAGLLGISYPPSQGSFSNEARPFMTPIINFLVQNNAPLLVNVYPYFSYIGDEADISLDYALFTSQGTVVQDGSFGYQNIFDAVLDAHYSALEKEGGSNVEIVVSETGWPSDGNPPAASSENAGNYYKNVISHVNSGQATPRRPGRGIETYLFAMFDENDKSGAETEKHFGLFFPNQQSKYGISFN
ncbi:glucan endo-1,3-beta-glucosidase-like [Coffea eugenioides]|uniref:glucan endo-1,3-beta-glucosidase-like n=1 Tax=Coffea eugenioides TaxID=49369 RepID=UPI000F604978|nr:glucan endo-1,3-beta-glucosidase-like [Coffea eugenioides]